MVVADALAYDIDERELGTATVATQPLPNPTLRGICMCGIVVGQNLP